MLIELLHQHNIITSSGKTNPGCNRLAKKYPYIFQQIINATIFCSEQATWGQRIFCIKNNITCLPRCKNCDKPTRYTIDCRYNEFCSSICANKCEIKNTKARQTCLKKYGVEYVLQTTLVKEKTKQTYLKKYGVEHNTQIFNYEENRKQTCLKKYGVEYVLQTTLVKEKTKQSCLKKYGVEHASQSEKIREKQKQTNLKRYGVEWNITSKHSREKQKQTKLEKYGIEHVHQKHIMDILHLLRDYNWLYNQYINKKKSITQIAEELNINETTLGNYLRRHNITIKHVGGFSHKCILWLESVMESQNIFIQHTQNIGEYRIPNTRLHVDGYCEETNTIYEFYGDMWHGNPNVFESHVCCNYFSNLTAGELYQNTMEREDLIKEMGYNFIVIWEKEWDENQNT